MRLAIALQARPEEPRTFRSADDLLRKLGRAQGADAMWERLLRQRPKELEAHLFLAGRAIDAKDWVTAQYRLRAALAIQPGHAEAAQALREAKTSCGAERCGQGASSEAAGAKAIQELVAALEPAPFLPRTAEVAGPGAYEGREAHAQGSKAGLRGRRRLPPGAPTARLALEPAELVPHQGVRPRAQWISSHGSCFWGCLGRGSSGPRARRAPRQPRSKGPP